MKKQAFYRHAAAVLLLLCASLAASAHDFAMRVEIPFAFEAGGKTLTAGKYVINRDPQMPQFLRVQSAEGKGTAVVLTIPRRLSQERDEGSLLFKGYGAKRFLAEIRMPGREEGYALIPSKAERELARTAKAQPLPIGPSGHY